MIPILLLPIQIINPITNKFEGEIKVSITPINFSTIKTITEQEETGYAIIENNSMGDIPSSNINTAVKFIDLLDTFNKMRIVDFSHVTECISYSKSLEDYIVEVQRSFISSQNLDNDSSSANSNNRR
jgi:hypothetical protein